VMGCPIATGSQQRPEAPPIEFGHGMVMAYLCP